MPVPAPVRHPRIVDPHGAGDREAAAAAYERWLPLINFENRQCGLLAAEGADAGGRDHPLSDTAHPVLPLHPAPRAGLLEIARRLDPLVLRWGR